MLVSGGNETKVAPDDPEPEKVVSGKLSALITAPEAEQPFDAKHPVTKRAMSQAMVMQVRERLGDSKVRAALRGSLGGMRFKSPLSAAAVLRARSPCRAEMPISARPDVRARVARVGHRRVVTAPELTPPRLSSTPFVSRRLLVARRAGAGAHTATTTIATRARGVWRGRPPPHGGRGCVRTRARTRGRQILGSSCRTFGGWATGTRRRGSRSSSPRSSRRTKSRCSRPARTRSFTSTVSST